MRPRSRLTLFSLQRDHRLLFLSSPCTMCLPSSPGPCVAPNASLLEQAVLLSGLFLLPQLISRFSSQSPTDLALHGFVCFSLPVICTACPYFLLCLTHTCVILISPVSLGLNLPHSSHWWLCRLPLPLVSGSITLPSSLFSFVSGVYYYWVRSPLFLFSWIVFCRLWMCLEMLSLLISYACWHWAKLRDRRQDNLLFPLSKQPSAGISPPFPITSLTPFLSFSHPNCNPYFPFFVYILELLEQNLTCSTYSVNICWIKTNEWMNQFELLPPELLILWLYFLLPGSWSSWLIIVYYEYFYIICLISGPIQDLCFSFSTEVLFHLRLLHLWWYSLPCVFMRYFFQFGGSEGFCAQKGNRYLNIEIILT